MKNQRIISLNSNHLQVALLEIPWKPNGINFCHCTIDIIKSTLSELIKSAIIGHPLETDILLDGFLSYSEIKNHFGDSDNSSAWLKYTLRELIIEIKLIVGEIFGTELFDTQIDFDQGFIMLELKNSTL